MKKIIIVILVVVIVLTFLSCSISEMPVADDSVPDNSEVKSLGETALADLESDRYDLSSQDARYILDVLISADWEDYSESNDFDVLIHVWEDYGNMDPYVSYNFDTRYNTESGIFYDTEMEVFYQCDDVTKEEINDILGNYFLSSDAK